MRNFDDFWLFMGEELSDSPSFSLDGRVEILTNTSCRHIRAWKDYLSLSKCVGVGLGDYDLGLGYVMVGNLERKSV
jgi:hypothetical protein